ncbi:hydroxymethylglutaryl-CoA synthase family protein [Dactylosporangium matsuzakiense]|uniref:Polyketide biosynthesis 3-hydroxy-3-methylglutaryl-ACP synthase PksG n=1 Tax=Dactylosporangium matsuzakiense TaxID=53360 RepID=A0A9W6KQJ7_9ACTN|nr:hydroxymethylglutaryl-CoA synthase family protein [Dactylosporangium matsuzakiense]UWZ42316.1 hydroxymethylglutaryl-CoA synthase family protein [Dactylosporangium matsuzakiense]GLL05310.1 polyketide biosynthesis 3-hydroxy-3-methylglutaryl-ACP synthase PksG [Dactylosporangium matsuzakiense]
MTVGIEAINAYVGRASLGVPQLFEARGLDDRRSANLMMDRKSVNLPCEDPVTNAVNAARPLVQALTDEERDRIELIIVGTESGLDFGKPISTYIQHYLGLGRRCRSFEVKHACYGGTAALQSAAAIIGASPVPGARALVIAADSASVAARNTYWEPSQGAGAVAMLVGRDAEILALDPGANGYHSFEVMDTLRPRPDLEAGDSDLSLMSYMECLEHSFAAYRERVGAADLLDTFDHLVFHTPFAGMVKSAYRRLRRKERPAPPAQVEADFTARVAPCLTYATRVGNVYSASLYLALCSLIDEADITRPERLGLFSYGSGCASEFYSGVVTPAGKALLARQGIAAAIADRYPLSMPEYELISDLSLHRMCGVQDHKYDVSPYERVYDSHVAGRGLLVLDRVENFHRQYRWS